MSECNRIIIVEDLPTDAELVEREVRKVLGACEFLCVETREGFIHGLTNFAPSFIISDFKLPQFDGLSALQIANERCPDVPFIIVTGSMNEDTAVECMKAGAWDYVIKEHVKRLGSAIESAQQRQVLRHQNRLAQDALRLSEEKYQLLFRTAPVGYQLLDKNGRILEVNQVWLETLGYEWHSIRGRWFGEFVHVDQRNEFRQLHEVGFKHRNSMRGLEYRLLKRDGGEMTAEFTIAVGRDADGNCIRTQGVFQDITERKQSESRIQLHQAHLKAVLESADFPIFAVDRALRYTSFNRVYANLIKAIAGVDVHVGDRMEEHSPSQLGWLLIKSSLERALLGETIWESVAHGDDPNIRYFEVTHNPVRTESGAIIGVSVFARDVTTRKRAELEREQLERQLRVSQKLEAIGSLAGGIAHDFNNLLCAILSYASLALANTQEGSELHGDLLEIRKAANRAAVLTRQLLVLGRKQILRSTALNLNDVIGGIEKMLRRLLREDVELSHALAPDLGMTFADPSQIEQVLMNLVVNARDAMPNGGTITIETSNVHLDEEFVAHQVGVVSGPYVQLAVRDTGHGMDTATQARIFEPFFTTKEGDQGTGLGLSIVYGIVKQSGGNIWVQSEPGKGTTFQMCLPRTVFVATPVSTPPPSLRRSRGSETILVVDDDDTVLRVVRRTLEKAGYLVLAAQSRDEALQVSATHKGEVQLLLTDVVMPHMSGKVLAEDLLKSRPDVQVLYMSGYAENAIMRHGVVDAGVQFISKPFNTGELLGTIRRILDPVTDRAQQTRVLVAWNLDSDGPIDANQLRLIPRELQSQLLEAVIAERHDKVTELIDTIQPSNLEVSVMLRKMADNFDYETLRWFLTQ